MWDKEVKHLQHFQLLKTTLPKTVSVSSKYQGHILYFPAQFTETHPLGATGLIRKGGETYLIVVAIAGH